MNRIDSLLEARSYFEAQRQFMVKKNGLSHFDSLRLAAVLTHHFNELEMSNTLINRLLSNFYLQMTDSLQSKLFALQYANHSKLYHYGTAYTLGKRLLRNYAKFLDEEEERGYRNANDIWKSLKEIPSQTSTVKGTSEIQMSRDKANLPNLPAAIDGRQMNFILDTGANISAIAESAAEELEMRHIRASILVGAITGKKVTASLAVCPSLQLGNMTFANVVFLVFPDEALHVEELDYQIRGILGFPVIEAMKQLTLTQDDRLLVPKTPEPLKEANMALNFLTPVIELEHMDGTKHPYTLDTGAVSSLLYPEYFKAYRKQIESDYEPEEFEFGGAGGSITHKGYKVSFAPKINGRALELDSVELITNDDAHTFRYFYGNLGQDVIQQFKTMTLNFESMYVSFN
ncbi:MAG: retropepsin-like aspartic protease [Bacteroidota bacterium]